MAKQQQQYQTARTGSGSAAPPTKRTIPASDHNTTLHPADMLNTAMPSVASCGRRKFTPTRRGTGAASSPLPSRRSHSLRMLTATPMKCLRWIPLLIYCLFVVVIDCGFLTLVSGAVDVNVAASKIISDHDRLLAKADKPGEVKPTAAIKSENESVKKWEDDDDDDDDSVLVENPKSLAKSDANQTQEVESIVVGGEQKDDDDDDDDDSVNKVFPAMDSPTGQDEKEVPAKEANVSTNKKWGDDDDDDDDNVQTDSSLKNAATTEIAGAVSEGKGKEATKSSDDDDDDDKIQNVAMETEGVESNSSYNDKGEVNADEGSVSPASEVGSLGDGAKSNADWPEDDDDDDDVGATKGAAADTLSIANAYEDEDNLIISAPSTAYHRNQSSEGEESPVGGDQSNVGGEVEKVASGEPGQETPSVNDAGAENIGVVNTPENMAGEENANDMVGENVGNIDGSEPSIPADGTTPTEGNENIIPPGNPSDVIVPGTEQNLQPPIGNDMSWEDDEEGSFFEMVQSTFNVLLLAAFLTSLLVLRKRVMDRVHADPSLPVPIAIKDELVDVAIRLATWAANRAREAGGGSSGAGGNNAASGVTGGNTRGSSYGNETIPLSTATDEEWGWEDDDMGTNLELSGMGGDDAKEDDDLALAIAMSLSESQSGGEEASAGTTSSVPPKSKFTAPSPKPPPRPISKKPPMRTSNITSSTFSSKQTGNSQIRQASVTPPKPKPAPTPTLTEPSSLSAGGDSIEDLLGQMGGTGGPMITSFGQKPKVTSKPKPTLKRDSSDDIFASMGLSSIPSTAAARAPPRPAAPSSGGWQASAKTQPIMSAPKSAPSPSLLATTVDDDIMDDDSWGDDEDLDDLLDD